MTNRISVTREGADESQEEAASRLQSLERKLEELDEVFIIESAGRITRHRFYQALDELTQYPEGIPILKRKIKELFEYKHATGRNPPKPHVKNRNLDSIRYSMHTGQAHKVKTDIYLEEKEKKHYQKMIDTFSPRKARELRLKLGSTQRELTKKTGVNQNAFSHYERGLFKYSDREKIRLNTMPGILKKYFDWLETIGYTIEKH